MRISFLSLAFRLKETNPGEMRLERSFCRLRPFWSRSCATTRPLKRPIETRSILAPPPSRFKNMGMRGGFFKPHRTARSRTDRTSPFVPRLRKTRRKKIRPRDDSSHATTKGCGEKASGGRIWADEPLSCRLSCLQETESSYFEDFLAAVSALAAASSLRTRLTTSRPDTSGMWIRTTRAP